MIKIQTLDKIENLEHIVKPTIFPDGTSQVWKLPEEFLDSSAIKATWYFEAERELIDICSLKTLLKARYVHLHIPFLPYARQDKEVDNNSTFNSIVFAKIINSLEFNLVTAVDVHSFQGNSLDNFRNIYPEYQISKVLTSNVYDGIVYPDSGAFARYKLPFQRNFITCKKVRDQITGEIIGHEIKERFIKIDEAKRVLIVDDICDGGATFISIAKMLKELNPNIKIDLYVTHGIFSKGKQVLLDAGIENIYTTNSILKNVDGFKV